MAKTKARPAKRSTSKKKTRRATKKRSAAKKKVTKKKATKKKATKRKATKKKPTKRRATKKKATKRKATKRKATKKKATKRKATKKKATKRKATKKKPTKRRATKKKATKRKATKKKATKKKAAKKKPTKRRATKKKATKRKATKKKAAPSQRRPKAEVPAPAGAVFRGPEDVRILVVDDEPEVLNLLVPFLRRVGYEVSEAQDGDQALEKILTERPNIVVLDVMMPALSGWEISRYVRERRELDPVRIIMATGIGKETNAATSPLYGADAYLDKPFRLDELDRTIKLVIRKIESGEF